MPTYAELYGGGNNSYVSVKKEDEQFVGLFKSAKRIPKEDIKTRLVQYLVCFIEGEKYQRKSEGEFNPDEVYNHFMLKQTELKLDLDGKEYTWNLSDSADEAFQSALKAAGGVEPGDTVGGKLIDTSKKPYVWKFKIIPADGE